jgi:gas vesicle protein
METQEIVMSVLIAVFLGGAVGFFTGLQIAASAAINRHKEKHKAEIARLQSLIKSINDDHTKPYNAKRSALEIYDQSLMIERAKLSALEDVKLFIN